MKNNPASLGYRMPAEWEPQSGIWLAWPHNPDTWPGKNLADIESVYIDIAQALCNEETVHILVNDFAGRDKAKMLLAERKLSSEQIKLHIIAHNDSWIRDYGPNFIIREFEGQKQLAFNNWGFNSWGGKYPWNLDNKVNDHIASALSIDQFKPGIVLEGGAIEVNGQGLCLTTGSCLLNESRNGKVTQEAMERYLQDHLGISKTIWLEGGFLDGDDTDGHIDNLARFVSPSTVVCVVEENPADPNYEGLAKNRKTLEQATDLEGNPLTVIPLPMPDPVMDQGIRLPASYANFYIGNRTVLLPAYGGEKDKLVEKLLRPLFPNREIVPIHSTDLIAGLGGIHCISQQMPST